MAERSYDALFIPRADEYLGEYLPERNERLRWCSGFTGSAGMLLLLRDRAALFVDGRYTVQVRAQCDPDLFAFHHLIDEPQPDYLCDVLGEGARVACDPRLHSWRWYRETRDALSAGGLELVADSDNLVDVCWRDRPALPPGQAILLEESYSGESSADKRARVGGMVAASKCEAALVFAPDAVSWLLNLRGRAMPQLPVLLGFAMLEVSGEVTLFTDLACLPGDIAAHVGPGVQLCAEDDTGEVFARYRGRRVLADETVASAWMHLQLREAGAEVVAGSDPVSLPKACKNAVELAGSRAAHRRDAVAVARFLCWLDGEIDAGRLHDEGVLAEHLLALRKQGEGFHALSFDTISAAGPNAAMCHYNHLDAGAAPLVMDSVYLCDSGGQYLDGTTDITRTVAVGDPGDEVRRLFTLVLKGHIALATARFPHGTCGAQLDALARQYLWAEGFDFDHGTGHGVGAFLSVHEGPQRIARTGTAALAPGMIVSDEPGYYRDGAFGMRCENLLAVCEVRDGEKPMLGFEVLTLAPFDGRLLDLQLLRADEVEWLNAYHARVYAEVGPLLQTAQRDWLQRATAPVAP